MADNGNRNLVAVGSGLNQQNVQQQQPVVPGNNDAAQLARQIQANTNIMMKTEVVKLPDFYREPGKDTITALEFMARIDECHVTNEWNDVATFSYFWLVLHGQADKWLSSTICHLQLMAAQKTWTRIRPVFKSEFAAFSDDKLIIDGLAKLAHRPNENPRMIFSCQEELIYILKENYASYRVKPEQPAQQPQGCYSKDALTKDIKENRQLQNFNNRGNNRSRGQGYRSNFNNNNCQNSNQPTSRNCKFCAYCKILNHTQEECRKHISDNKTCVTNKRQLYWPKVNSTTDNPNTVQNNSDPSAINSVFL
jgi:hypothetical protein